MTKKSELSSYFQFLFAMGKQAMAQKKADGQLMHQAPLGYRNVHIDGRSLMVVDQETRKLIDEARRLRVTGSPETFHP